MSEILNKLLNLVPLNCDIVIYPNKKYVRIEFFDENYCGGLEEFCGNWSVEDYNLESVIEKSILKLKEAQL